MLLYINSPAFIGRTFVVSCNKTDSIARLKANIFHILYEMGRGSHQFRLRFKNQYLKDSVTIEEYGIVDSHVVKMLPLSNKSFTQNPLISSASSLNSRETDDTLQCMLHREVDTLKLREKLCNDMQVCLWILFVFGVITFVTEYWFLAFHKSVFAVIALYLAPKYTRLAGFYLRMNNRDDLIVFALAGCAGILFLSSALTLFLMHQYTCKYITQMPHCSETIYFSVVIYFVETLVSLGVTIFSLILWKNFNFKIGNYIEPVLVEVRDIKYIFAAAKSKSVKEKRSAALDLANMAASSVDNKFALVTEGGLQVLIDLALSEDEGIRGYAIEAISELLTIKSIQNEFVDIGGINTLMFALHSTNHHVIKESILAICQLVQDNEDNMALVLGENGMDDLCHVINNGTLDCVRLVAGIFLDVSFCDNLRAELLRHPKYVPTFERLIRMTDPTTQQLTLQTLEMIALTAPQLIISHISLIPALLKAAYNTSDVQVKTISAKLLLYFVESSETIEEVTKCRDLKYALRALVQTHDHIIQNVASKMLYSSVEFDRNFLQDDEFVDMVQMLQLSAIDQEAWMLSDKILMLRSQ